MYQIMPALQKSASALTRWSLWRCLLAPLVVAQSVFAALLWWGYIPSVNFALQNPPLSWFVNENRLWLALLLGHFEIWVLFSSMAYLAALLISALFMLPSIIDDVARHDYPGLVRMGRDGPMASVRNTLTSALGFVAGWAASLILWVIPGVGFILPLLLMGWLNRRTFSYDTMVAFATPEEWQKIQQRDIKPLFVMGLMLAMLAHVPFFGLFIPAVAALAYTHYSLAVLNRLREDTHAQASLEQAIWEADEL